MRVIAIIGPVVDMPVASILAVVSGPIYHISRPVFAFPLVKIVFLIIKLVKQG